MESIIEVSFALSLFVNAILFIPQIFCMIKAKSAKNVSFITFFGFWVIQLSTVLHGFLRKDLLLTAGTLISMLTCGYVIFLILYYRLRNGAKA